jgi:hypothetical protein
MAMPVRTIGIHKAQNKIVSRTPRSHIFRVLALCRARASGPEVIDVSKTKLPVSVPVACALK